MKIRNSYFGNTCGEQDIFTQDVKEEKFPHPFTYFVGFYAKLRQNQLRRFGIHFS